MIFSRWRNIELIPARYDFAIFPVVCVSYSLAAADSFHRARLIGGSKDNQAK